MLGDLGALIDITFGRLVEVGARVPLAHYVLRVLGKHAVLLPLVWLDILRPIFMYEIKVLLPSRLDLVATTSI